MGLGAYHGGMTYFIPECNLSALELKLAQLAKKSAKLGQELTFRRTGRVEDRPYLQDEDSLDTFLRYVELEVQGTLAKIQGWEFIACIQHTDAGNLIKAAHTEVPSRYRDAKPACDHCRTNRLRLDTFLLRNEAGEVKQVGRSCLADFTGHANPHQLAEAALLVFVVDELCHSSESADFHNFNHNRERYSLDAFLVRAAHSIRAGAFVSRAVAREHGGEATADTAWAALTSRDGQAAWREVGAEERQAAVQLAEAARNWVSTEVANKVEMSDYEHNLVVVNQGESVSSREAGLAASIVSAYQRAQARKAEQARVANSQHLGVVGARLRKLPVEVTRVVDFGENEWGHSYLYIFADDIGNVLSWKTGGQCLTQGDKVLLTATVK